MTRISSILTVAAVALVATGAAFAEDDATSLSYISYVERYATLRPANGNESLDVVVNMPVLAGDRLVTARAARVEIVLADATTVWLDEFSTLDFDALAFSRESPASRTVLYLADGTAAFELPAHGLGDATTRLDTPAGTIFLQRPGLYRVDIDRGQVEVRSFAGLAELPSGAGSALLRAGQQAYLTASGRPETRALYETRDEFWRWVSERRRPAPPGRTAEQVGSRAASRAAILDSYGDWIYVDSYWAWRPRVAVTWVPYSYGRWYWTPVGWTWISYEPWGWYPYHYGSWTYHPRHGWLWCWDWVWGPAWVHWFYSGSYIGWCPRGYYDSWYWSRYRHFHGSYPGRWSQVTLDFRGRIYLGDIDLRPWTVVPASHFAHARLDRVRLSPERIRQELPRTPAYVRSGPLLTRDVRPDPNAFEREFRRGLRDDNIPDLTRVLRREEGAVDVRQGTPAVRMLPTGELIRGAERAEGGADVRGGAPGRGGVPGRTDLPGRGEVRGRNGSEWPGERQPAPVRGGQPGLGSPGRSSGGSEDRTPIRIPERSRPERVDPGTPARGEVPDTPRREVGRPAPDRSQPGGAPSAPGPAGEDARRPPERSAPAPVRPPAGSSDPGASRSSAPPPARPPAEQSRPAPPPPRQPESPPPSSQRSFDDRFDAPGRAPARPSSPVSRGGYGGSQGQESWGREPSAPSRPVAAPPPRPAAPRSDSYAPPPRAAAPAPRAEAPPPRSAPAPRAPAPGASSGSASGGDGGRPSRPPGPGRPAPSRPDR